MSHQSPELGTGEMWITPDRTLIHFGGISAPPASPKPPLVLPDKGVKS